MTILSEELNLVPSNHIRQLTTTRNFNSRAFYDLFFPLRAPTLTCAYSYTDTLKTESKPSKKAVS